MAVTVTLPSGVQVCTGESVLCMAVTVTLPSGESVLCMAVTDSDAAQWCTGECVPFFTTASRVESW